MGPIHKMHKQVSLCCFFYRQGVVLQFLIPKKKSVTGTMYKCKIVQELKQQYENKHLKPSIKGLLLLHDNAPVHKSKLVTYFFFSKDGVIEIPRPAYSSDLLSRNLFLFPKHKTFSSKLKDAIILDYHLDPQFISL